MLFKLLLILFLHAEEPWGPDASLATTCSSPCPKNPYGTSLISFFQEVISPIDGMRSCYRPSSSEYMKGALQHYGFLKGIPLGCDRLLRENSDAWYYRSIQWNGFCMKYDPPYECTKVWGCPDP